jgi:hypothetical protein
MQNHVVYLSKNTDTADGFEFQIKSHLIVMFLQNSVAIRCHTSYEIARDALSVIYGRDINSRGGFVAEIRWYSRYQVACSAIPR